MMTLPTISPRHLKINFGSSKFLALLVATALAIAGTVVVLGTPAPAMAEDTSEFSIEALRSMPLDDLRALAQKEWDKVVSAGKDSTFAPFSLDNHDQSRTVSMDHLREVLDKAVAYGFKTPSNGFIAQQVGTGSFLSWLDQLPESLQKDFTGLEYAATMTNFVPILGNVMNLVVSASEGSPTGIAGNTVLLVAGLLSYILPGPLKPVAGLIALLIAKFIYAFEAVDNSPIAWSKLVSYRDERFVKLLPDFARDFFTSASEGFSRLQTRVVYELGLADAAIDAGAKAAAQTDPSSGNATLTKASVTKRVMHDSVLSNMAQVQSNFVTATKEAFSELITNATTNTDELTSFTDKVFPRYHPNYAIDMNAPLAWDNGPGVDTVGWEFFAAQANDLQKSGDTSFSCTTKDDGTTRSPVDYSNMPLRELWDKCDAVVHSMNETWLQRVSELRTTHITVPEGKVQTAIDTAMALPAVIGNFTTVTAIPSKPKDQPWAISTPTTSSAGVSRTALISGTGQAGHTVQVRSATTTVCSAAVDDYGYWSCVPENLVAPGASTSYDLYDGQGSPMNTSVALTFAGTKLAFNQAPPTGSTLVAGAGGAITGFGTPDHKLTVTVFNHHVDGSNVTKSLDVTVSPSGDWSAPLTSALLDAGAAVTVTVADKSLNTYVYTTFTTAPTLRFISPGSTWTMGQLYAWSGSGVPGDVLDLRISTNDPFQLYQSKTLTSVTVAADGWWGYQPTDADVSQAGEMELTVTDTTNGDVAFTDFTAR